VQYHVPVIQQIAADALRHALTEHPQSLSPTLQKLFDIYNVKLEVSFKLRNVSIWE